MVYEAIILRAIQHDLRTMFYFYIMNFKYAKKLLILLTPFNIHWQSHLCNESPYVNLSEHEFM